CGAPRGKACRVGEHREITLVRKASVNVGIWREDHVSTHISIAQRGVRGVGKGEIDEAIVDEVYRLAFMHELSALGPELRWIGDNCRDAVPLEECLREYELGIEVLGLGIVIDDGDALGPAPPALQTPLFPEHLQYGCLEIETGNIRTWVGSG